ncbi:MAG: hypothetical protein FWH12_09640 [Treponema sp.]|nr:hypothetical protein [Treponema sp.]
MDKRIYDYELDGKIVLGFDTDLKAHTFAQAKLAQYITRPGLIVYPDGETETWLTGGVSERTDTHTMVIWGPSFPAESVADIIEDPAREEEALNVLRYWIRARMVYETLLDEELEAPYPGPSGAFIVSKNFNSRSDQSYPLGTIFFPPYRLIRRTVDAGGQREIILNNRWVHPDLEGSSEISFAAGTMLYRIFCGVDPFTNTTAELIRQDMREGVFVPPHLMKPGLDPELSAFISKAMARIPHPGELPQRPSPSAILEFISSNYSRPVSSWMRSLSHDEVSRINQERERFNKNRSFKVNTRRFMIKHTTAIVTLLVAIVSVVGFANGYIQRQLSKPNTLGMSPIEVVETYYRSFGDLDHELMEACLTHMRVGRSDIDMVINVFVLSRMRMSYEYIELAFMQAQEWIDSGRPSLTEVIVFGITDLDIRVLYMGEEEAHIDVSYLLWIPGTFIREAEGPPPMLHELDEYVPPPTAGAATNHDMLRLVYQNDMWRIAQIDRNSEMLPAYRDL